MNSCATQDLIALDPKIKISMDADPPISFDFGLKVKLPDYENLDTDKALEKLLPQSVRFFLHYINS